MSKRTKKSVEVAKPVVEPFTVGDYVAIGNGVGWDAGGRVIASDKGFTIFIQADGSIEAQNTNECYLIAKAGIESAPESGPYTFAEIARRLVRHRCHIEALIRAANLPVNDGSQTDEMMTALDSFGDKLRDYAGTLLFLDGCGDSPKPVDRVA